MKEIGKVVEKNNEILKVELSQSNLCASCKMCERGQNNMLILEALNECNADVGDNVIVELDRKDFYKATLTIYAVPLLSFLIFVIIGYAIGNAFKIDPQLSAFIIGLLGLGIGFLISRLIDRHFSKNEKKFIPVVKKIV